MAPGVNAAERHGTRASLRSRLVSKWAMVLLAGRTADRQNHMASGGRSQLWRSGELPDVVTARVIGGVSALAGGLVLVERHESWLDLRAGENTWTYTATEIPVYGRLVVLLALTVTVGALIEGVVLGRWPLRAPTVAALALVLLSVALLGVCELAMTMVPTDLFGWLLPTTVERAAGGARAGLGAWATLGAAGLTVALAHSRMGHSLTRRTLAQATPLTAGGAALAVATVGAAIWIRYQPWAHGAAAGHEVEVPGAGLPWVGPGSLVAVLALGSATFVGLARPGLAAPLLAATAGWALSLAGAVTILVGGVVTRFDVRRLMSGDVGAAIPRLGAAPGAWLGFGIGLAAAVGSVGVLCARCGRHRAPLQEDAT